MIHYRDLVAPDNSITDLIKQLQEMQGVYNSAISDIKRNAAALADTLKGVSGATDEGRNTTRGAASEADRLAKAYRDMEFAGSEAAKRLQELKQATKEQADIDKLLVKIANSAEGSYNRLSAQYSLNKIYLNNMSAAERSATESGRQLEAETKAIYEEMNRLQKATGKAQLQVGHYELALSSLDDETKGAIKDIANFTGVNNTLTQSLLDSNAAGAQLSGIMKALKTPIGAIIGIVGSLVGVFKLFKASVNSTQTSGDELAHATMEWDSVWQRFSKAVASVDFGFFIKGAADAAKAGRELSLILDETFERTNSVRLLKASLSQENAALEEAARNTALSYEERLAAANKYIENMMPIYEQETETAKRNRDARLNYLFTLTAEGKKMTDEEKKRAEEEFAANIKNYNLNEELFLQAQAYLDAEKARRRYIEESSRQGQAGYYTELIREQEQIIANTSDEAKAFSEFVKQYNLSNDEQIQAYVDAEENYQRALAASYNDQKRFINLRNSIIASQAKEEENRAKAAAKAREDAAKAEAKAVEDAKKEAEDKTKADEQARQAEINNQKQILQAQAQTIALSIATAREGSDEMLQLRIDAINKQREIELFNNRNNAENLRQDERAINAKYDAQILREDADFRIKRANEEFAALQANQQSEFDLVERSEREKAVFRLEQEKARLQKTLELNKVAANKLSDIEIETIRNTIAKIDSELETAKKSKNDIYDIIGLDISEKKKDAMDKAVSETISNIGEIVNAWETAAQKRLEAADKAVDAAQSELESEIEARNNGYANNVETAQKNLDLQKKNYAEAAAEQKRAARVKEALDTASQASSLVTASALIWAQLGFPWAIPALAVMWGSFAVAKVKALQVAGSSKTEEYGDGTVELLDGGSHASGHDIDMGVKKDGTRRRAEGGEFFAVINKRNSRRYRSVIPDVINSFNDGTFADKYMRANDAMNGYVVNVMGGVDVSGIERDVRAIRKRGNESSFVDGRGTVVMKYKNLTRRIKS